jgi:hypothetical protein
MYKLTSKKQVDETIVYEHKFPYICKNQIYIHFDYGALNNYVKIRPVFEEDNSTILGWQVWYYSLGKSFIKHNIKLSDIDFLLIDGELKHVSLKNKDGRINNVVIQYLLDTNIGRNYFYEVTELDFAKQILKFINY